MTVTKHECAGRLLCRICASTYLGISPKSFERHVRSKLPIVLLGKLPRWARDDIDRWITQSRIVSQWQTKTATRYTSPPKSKRGASDKSKRTLLARILATSAELGASPK